MRLTGIDVDIYRYLEPLYNDYRKLRRKLPEGSMVSVSSSLRVYASLFQILFLSSLVIVTDFSLTHVDEVIDELLTKDYSCDIALPRIKKRYSKPYK